MEAIVRHSVQYPGATPGKPEVPVRRRQDDPADDPVVADGIDLATPYMVNAVISGTDASMCDGDPVIPGADAPRIRDAASPENG